MQGTNMSIVKVASQSQTLGNNFVFINSWLFAHY